MCQGVGGGQWGEGMAKDVLERCGGGEGGEGGRWHVRRIIQRD